MLKAATIDIGSNSVKYLLIEYSESGIKALQERVEVTRLATGLQATRMLSHNAMARTVQAIKEFVVELEQLGTEQIFIVGTMALRTAGNADRFKALLDQANLPPLDILPGAEEARLSHLAVVNSISTLMNGQEYCIYDTGGGSTEFIFGNGQNIGDRFSLGVGVVRFTEEFLSDDQPNKADVAACKNQIASELTALDGRAIERLIGVGGTVTTLAATHLSLEPYDASQVHGAQLTRTDIAELLERYLAVPLSTRQQIIGLHPKRADVIIAGLLITQVIMEKLNVKELMVSDAGLRLGVLIDRLKLAGKPFEYAVS